MYRLAIVGLLSITAFSSLAAEEFRPPQEGLLVWLDAADLVTVSDGAFVDQWTSKAGIVPVTFVASGRQRPQLRHADDVRAAVVFDGINDVLRADLLNRSTDTWTLIAVIAPDAPLGGGGIFSANPIGSHDYEPGLTVDLYAASTSFDQISIEGAGRIGGQKDQMQSDYPPSGMHIVSVVRDSNVVRLYVDGKLEGTRDVTAAPTLFDQLRVGSRFFGGVERQYFHGEIATMLFYECALNDALRYGIEAALNIDDQERTAGLQRAARARDERLKEPMTAPQVVQSWPDVESFQHDRQGAVHVVELPVRTDLRHAIELSMIHLNSLFDADHDDEPYFYVNRMADGTGKMFHSIPIGIPHVVGRSLLGTMMGEMATGIPFPDRGLAIYERYCRSSFDNPDHLNSYFDPDQQGKRCIEFHNMREGLYGLWALIAGRDSAWARTAAHEMLETLDRLTDEDGRWSMTRAAEMGMADRCYGVAIPNSARMVDALLAYHACTGDELAWKLAGLYARQGLETIFTPEGRFASMDRSSGHVHSITSSLSGIAAYAIASKDTQMLERCRQIVDVGVPDYFSSWGWGDEVYSDHPADVVLRGEINQTGDVVRTALLLGSNGYPDYYELAERHLRSMLLPTQHRRPELDSFLRDADAPADDSQRGTVERSIGGYAMQLPNDRMRDGDWPVTTLDITSGAVHAMSECYRLRTVADGREYSVNLLFDYADDRLLLQSGLPLEGRLQYEAKGAIDRLQVRIPPWVDRSTIRLQRRGTATALTVDGSYAIITGITAGEHGTLSFAVPVKIERERVDGTQYTTTWVGNQLIDIQPRGIVSPLPF